MRSLATASALPVGEVQCGAEVPLEVVRRATPGHPFFEVLAGPDAGIVEAALDGGPFTATDAVPCVQPDPPLSAHGPVGSTAPGGGSVSRGI